MTLVCFAVDYKETKSSAKLFSHLFLIDVEHCTPNRSRELNKQHTVVGDNSLSVKECICEENSLAWKEMQHTHWQFPQVYTREIYIHLLLTLLPKELPSAPIESYSSLSISLTHWAQWQHAGQHQSLCVLQSLSGILGPQVRATATIRPADVQRCTDYW